MSEQFLKRNIPVIITDATDEWPARRLFNLNFLHNVSEMTKLKLLIDEYDSRLIWVVTEELIYWNDQSIDLSTNWRAHLLKWSNYLVKNLRLSPKIIEVLSLKSIYTKVIKVLS